MKITRVEAWLVKMQLTEPYTAAYDTIETTANVFVRIVTDGRIVGCGCAAPDEQVTGETPEGVLEVIRTVVEPAVKGTDPLRPALLRERLERGLRHEPSARAAVDMALFDILGKKCELPVWKLLGGYRDCMKTSVTIGILSEPDAVASAQQWIKQGFTALKMKGGLDVDSDVARVLKVREAVGDGIELRFDANQGYTVDEALRFIDLTRDARLELLEQPTLQGQPDLLGEVSREVSLPIMADESLASLRDAFRLASSDLTDMLNVKLMKVGGISEAMEIVAVAKSARLKVMVGSVDESALGVAAGLHYALSSPAVVYADLDGHLGLQDDPAAGAVQLDAGILYPTNRPGLGFDLPA